MDRGRVRVALVAVALLLFIPGLHGLGALVDLMTAAGLGLIALAIFPQRGWRPRNLLRWGVRNFLVIYFGWGALLIAWFAFNPEQSGSHPPVDYVTSVGALSLPVGLGLVGLYLLLLALALDTWSVRPRLIAIGLSLLVTMVIVGETVLARSHDLGFDFAVLIAFLFAGLVVRLETPHPNEGQSGLPGGEQVR